ncbi:MAG: ribose 5-phosphate isomerase B [Deltaproteobacteria bacterium]|nr:ribose 5-phosphate isomerase B [Deltaproteobacteria bacterium]
MDKSEIIIGCDHAAFAMKEKIKERLNELGIMVQDVGTFSEESVNYPDFGAKVASSVASGAYSRGILLCGTGIGMSIVANRFPGVRATLCNDLFSAKMARAHNDSNLLVLGGRVIGDVLAMEILDTWLTTPFEGGRHQVRLDKIDQARSAEEAIPRTEQ